MRKKKTVKANVNSTVIETTACIQNRRAKSRETATVCVEDTKKKKKRRKGNTTHCYSSSLRVSRIGLGGMEESRRLANSDKKKALRNRAKKKKQT